MGQLTNALIFFTIFIVAMLLVVFLGNLFLADPTNLFLLFALLIIVVLFGFLFFALASVFGKVIEKHCVLNCKG